MKNNKFTPTRFLKATTVFILLLALGFNTRAQVTISYPSPAQQITRGLDQSLLTVNLGFASACTGINVSVRLPAGVSYVPGSVTAVSGTGGLTITEAGGTPRTPSFAVKNAVVGNDITFTIKRIADCGSGSSGKDSIYVTGSCGTSSETNPVTNNYNILAPALSITPPATITNAAIGSNYSRTFTVTNGGNGCLDTLQVFVVRTAGSIGSPVIKIGAATIPVHHTSGDTSFYRIFGANLPGGDNLMCNGETITFTETFTLVNCLRLNSTYGAGWGRDKNVAAQCGVSTATGLINLASGVPAITVTSSAPAATGCVTQPRVLTFVFTNTGTGPATNLNLMMGANYNGGAFDYSYFVDTSALMVSLPTGGAFHPSLIGVNYTIDNNNPNNHPPCAFGKVNGVNYTVPAGFILAVGQSITISFPVSTCVSASCAPGSYDAGQYGAAATYKDQCGTTNYNLPIGAAAIAPGLGFGGGISSIEMPAQVFSGQCFDMTLDAVFNYSLYLGTGYVEYIFTIPAGVTFNSITELLHGDTPLAGYPIVSGNTVTVRYPHNPSGSVTQKFKINFCVPASVCGPVTFTTESRISLDGTCATPVFKSTCATNTITSICFPPCPTGGATPVKWTNSRITFGAPDNDNNGVPDATGSVDLAKVETTHYMPGDVMRTSIASIITSNSVVPYATWPYVFAEWDFGGAPLEWQPQGTVSIQIKRAGTIIQSLTGITPSVLTANNKFKADWSSSLPGGFAYQNGDSVFVTADFKLVGNISYNLNGTYGPYNGRTIYNKTLTESVYASQSANPPATGTQGPDRYSCFIPQYNYFVLGSERFIFGTADPAGPVGCNNLETAGFGYTTVLSYVGNRYYPYEIRPTVIPDTVIFNIPAGWQFVSHNFFNVTHNTSPGQISNFNVPIVPVVTGNVATGTQLLYDIKATIASGAFTFLPTEQMITQFNMFLKPTCGAPLTAPLTMIENGHYYNYPSAASPSRYSMNYTANTLNYKANSRPSISLQNNTGIVQGVAPQHYWDVQVNNPSSQTAPFVWLSLEKGAGAINVDSVVLKPSNIVLTPTNYGPSDKWYKISTAGIVSGGNQQARIYFKYGSCALDSIKASIGWNCPGYPVANPNEAGVCTQESQYLKVQSQLSQVQLSIEKQPTAPSIAMCDTDSVTAIINSALGANVDNPTVTIIPPVGLLIINPIQVEYPLNSGNWQTITAANVGGNFVINLEQHTAIGAAGLPGVLVNPLAEPRQARIKFKYNSSCPFVSGSRLGFIVNGQNPCGSTASTGNNDYINSLPINITGAIAPGSAGMTIDVNPPELSCDNVVTVPFNITPVSLGTQTGDKAVYTLPAGVTYAGGFTPGANCTGCTIAQSAGTGGATILTVSLPAGVPAGTTMAFTLGIKASDLQACGNTLISGQAEREIGALNCNSTACPSGHAVIGSVTQSVLIKKPKVNTTSLGFTQSGNTINYTVTLANVGTQDAPAGYLVNIYCGTAATDPVIHQFMTTAPIAIGATATVTGTYTNNPATCPGGSAISAQLQDTLANGTRVCMCGPSVGATSLTVLPVKLESFTAAAKDCKAVLSWRTSAEINFKGFEVEYSSNGATFSKVAVVAGSNNINGSTYKFTYVQPDSKEYYRLKMTDLDGRFEYSKVIPVNVDCNERIIAVSPNPTQGMVTVTGLKPGDYLQLYSMDGKLLLKKDITSTQIQLDLTRYGSDVFTVSVLKNDGTVTTSKIVKIK